MKLKHFTEIVWSPHIFNLEGFRCKRGSIQVRETDCSWAAGFRTGEMWSWSFMWEDPPVWETYPVSVRYTSACLAQSCHLNRDFHSSHCGVEGVVWAQNKYIKNGCSLGWTYRSSVSSHHDRFWVVYSRRPASGSPSCLICVRCTWDLRDENKMWLKKLQWRTVLWRRYLP